jgi:hypothetical protein
MPNQLLLDTITDIYIGKKQPAFQVHHYILRLPGVRRPSCVFASAEGDSGGCVGFVLLVADGEGRRVPRGRNFH